MPAPPDHIIASRVRSILDRLWIDPAGIDFGSVNGVVYLRGELRRLSAYPPSRVREEGRDALGHLLRRQLGAIDGVKDVSLDLNDFESGDDPWESNPKPSA